MFAIFNMITDSFLVEKGARSLQKLNFLSFKKLERISPFHFLQNVLTEILNICFKNF